LVTIFGFAYFGRRSAVSAIVLALAASFWNFLFLSRCAMQEALPPSSLPWVR